MVLSCGPCFVVCMLHMHPSLTDVLCMLELSRESCCMLLRFWGIQVLDKTAAMPACLSGNFKHAQLICERRMDENVGLFVLQKQADVRHKKCAWLLVICPRGHVVSQIASDMHYLEKICSVSEQEPLIARKTFFLVFR